MSDNDSPIERLDLRFKAIPAREAGSWLPFSVWLWFALGIIAGIVGWQFGHQRLQNQLGQRVQSNTSPAEALLALEALDLLNSKDQDYFVTGLSHPDARVAKSALQILTQRIEQWPSLESTVYYAELRTLANLLSLLPNDLPDENRLLVQCLAARLFSICVSVDDPQLQAVSKICQQLMTLGNRSETLDAGHTRSAVAHITPPPDPLPKFTDTASYQLLSDASESSGIPLERQFASDSELNSKQSSSSTEIRPLAVPGNQVAVSLNAQSIVARSFEAQSSPDSDVDLSTKVPELPVLVSTPASIASQPVVRMRVLTDQPELAGIERAEPAELIRLLDSQNSNVAKGAALALRYHGFSDVEIALASELATGPVERRLELIQQIATSNSMAPQPWLIWMAEDGQPEVRRMAISLLNSMQTAEVQQSLRMLLLREPDQDIKDLIRKVLLSSPSR